MSCVRFLVIVICATLWFSSADAFTHGALKVLTPGGGSCPAENASNLGGYTLSTSGSTASGTTLPFSSTTATAIAPGYTVSGTNIPANTFVASLTATTVTLTRAISGTVGSGASIAFTFTKKVIGNFDDYPQVWIEDLTHQITVGAAIGDRAWIAQVVFCINGNTLTVSSQSQNGRTGSYGWSVIPQTGLSSDGDYTLYAYIQPVNGYERRISLPITLNSNNTITRSTFYINYTNGNDAWTGTSATFTSGTTGPWKTFQKGAVASGSGSIVYYAVNQTYIEDATNPPPFGNANTRMTSFRPLAAGGVATISSSTVRANLLLRANLIEVEGVTWDTNGISGLQLSNGVAAIAACKRCAFNDPNGPAGPTYGYASNLGAGWGFVTTNGQWGAIVESTVNTQQIQGYGLGRNISGTISWDALNIGSSVIENLQGGKRTFNVNLAQPADFVGIRDSTLANPVVASTAFGSGNTVITLSGSPGLFSVTQFTVQFVTGALAGQQFVGVTQTSGGSTTTVVGNATGAAPGDTIYIFSPAHADAMQFNNTTTTDPTIENMYFQRYKVPGLIQLVLGQRGQFNQSGTLSTTGTAVTFSTVKSLNDGDFIVLNGGAQSQQYREVVGTTVTSTSAVIEAPFTVDQVGTSWIQAKTARGMACVACILDYTGAPGAVGQIQHGQDHFVYVQSDLLGSNYLFRNQTTITSSLGGFGIEQFTFFDSITYSLTSSSTYPTVGMNVDNIHNEVFGSCSGCPSADGVVVFDTNYKPTSGLSKTMKGILGSGLPMFPWTYGGTPIGAGALVGAQQP